MANLLSDLQLIELSFLMLSLQVHIDKRFTGISKFPLQDVLKLVAVGVLIGAIYLMFTQYIWWKAILLFLASLIIGTIGTMVVSSFLSAKSLITFTIIGLLFTSILLIMTIFY